MEVKLWSLVLLILDQNGLPSPKPGTTGYVLDAGANDGASAQAIARALNYNKVRTHVRVLAVEPLRSNVMVIKGRTRQYPNIEVLHAGLGAIDNTVGHYPLKMDNKSGNLGLQINAWTPELKTGEATYPIVTVDALFAKEKQRTLLFAHLDLEGLEHVVLPAANETIMRDRPIVTVETYPVLIPHQHKAVMAYLDSMNYRVYTVEEIVGGFKDGRNRIGIPKERQRLVWTVHRFFNGGIGKVS